MKLTVDREADALHLALDDVATVESDEVAPGVILDFNAQGMVVGVEILSLSMRTPVTQLDRIELTGVAV